MRKIILSLVLAFSTTVAVVADTNQIALNYNFNGIVHGGEAGQPDAPNGYRSISDRGLDFTAGVPTLTTSLGPYSLVGNAGALDIVHLGNRNTVDFGNRPFDADGVDGDAFGVQPDWLADPDQTGPQTTVLTTPILLDGTSEAGFIFQISNGGGNFDVRFSFDSGADFVATLNGPDWFGPNNGMPNIGAFAGTGSTDNAFLDADLLLTEGIVDLSAEAGRTLTAITFENRSNVQAGYAILAANVTAVPEPAAASVLVLGAVAFLRRRR